jgi:WD40 repeat protein
MFLAAPDPSTYAINFYDPDNNFEIVGSLLGHTGPVRSLAVADRVPRMATADPDLIRVWDIEAMSEITNLQIDCYDVCCMGFSEIGDQLVATGQKDLAWTITKWDLLSRCCVFSINNPLMYTSTEAFFLAGDSKIMSAKQENIGFWDASSGAELNMFNMSGDIYGLAKSPDETAVAVALADSKIAVMDVNTGEVLQSFQGLEISPSSICYSADGLRLACGALEGKSVVWDVLTGTVVATIGSLRRAYEVSLNFDGTQIICFDNEGCVYDVATGTILLELPAVFRGVFFRSGVILM